MNYIERPSHDERFMMDALNASTRSNCLVRHVGATLAKDNKPLASGYNGAPPDHITCLEIGDCLYQKQAHEKSLETGEPFHILKELFKPFCIVIHAEKNVFRFCTDEEAEGSTLYTTTFPCFGCVRDVIIPKKVSRIVYWQNFLSEEYDMTMTMINSLKGRQIKVDHLDLTEDRIDDLQRLQKQAGGRLSYRFQAQTTLSLE